MTERKKIGLPARAADDQPSEGRTYRKPPVRGTAPRQRPTAAQAEAARAAREAERQAERQTERPPAYEPSDPDRRPARGPGRGPDRASERGPARGGHDRHGAREGDRFNERHDGRYDRAPDRPRAPRPPVEAVPPREDDGRVRLSKLMSEQGLASRREADTWIEHGWVRVDGEVVDELGTRVFPHQNITVDPAAREQQAQQVTILLHKPIGYVSGQAEDGHEPAVLLITPENHWKDDRTPIRFNRAHLRKLAPAGRLDIDSTGLLVLTQDGRVAKALIGEDSAVDKEYLVRVQWAPNGPQGAGVVAQDVQSVLPRERLALLRHGLSLDGQRLKPAEVTWQNPEQLRFVLTEGKKRQIRRMCEQVGLHVVGLKRVRIGRVALGQLPVGQWRFLGADEGF